jgi:hypothetical protein
MNQPESMSQVLEGLGQHILKLANVPVLNDSASFSEKLDKVVAMVEAHNAKLAAITEANKKLAVNDEKLTAIIEANDEKLAASVEAVKGDIKNL